ncbi:MAG: hypothetical protein LC799_00835 [Actinobacteria bacterium]|nr:hypothetical protein [Actinomycetota bacterium]
MLDDDVLTISTIHSVKGPEWDVVHVLHLDRVVEYEGDAPVVDGTCRRARGLTVVGLLVAPADAAKRPFCRQPGDRCRSSAVTAR